MRVDKWGILHHWALGKLNSMGSWCTKLSDYIGGWCRRKLNSMSSWVKKKCRLPPPPPPPPLGITICHHSAGLVMSIGDTRDQFFYPTLTLMIDTKILIVSILISVQLYQDLACCAAVKANGANVEHALHLLYLMIDSYCLNSNFSAIIPGPRVLCCC